MMTKEQLQRLVALENQYDSGEALTPAQHNERYGLLRVYHEHKAERREQEHQNARALDALQAYLAADSRRYVERMARSPLGYDVAIRREDGRLAQSITQLTLAGAINTVLMVAGYP